MFNRLRDIKSNHKDRWKPLKRPTLGISWVQGQFHAVFFESGICISRWHSSTPVHTTLDFSTAVTEACKQLNVAQNSDVAMVYESEKLAHPFIQVPPMSSKDLVSFLTRRVPQEKAFAEDAAWSWTHTFAAKEGQGILLHLLPEDFRKEIIQTLEDLKLYPKTLLPLSQVMAQHTLRLPVEDDDVVAMLATFAGETDILITRGDGEILFTRDLGYNWQDNIDVLVRDVDRSILYAKQQFGVAVNKLSTAGEGSAELHAEMENRVNLPMVSANEDDHHAYCWAMDICNLSPRRTSNLIPLSVQRRRGEKLALRFGIMTTSALMICAALTVIQVEILVANSTIVHNAKGKLAALSQEKNLWSNKSAALEASKIRLTQLNATNHAAYPVRFFSYLGNIVPADLILKKVTVVQEGEISSFSISGSVKGSADSRSLIKNMNLIDSRLSASPLNASMDDGWKESPDRILGRGSSEEAKQSTFILKGNFR